MTTVRLTDEQWTNMRTFLHTDPHVYIGRDDRACRRFVEAVLWIDRSGVQWRLLPTAYGRWNSVYKRFARWCDQGVWERMLAHVADDPDMEHGMVDSTIVRAHTYSARTMLKEKWFDLEGLRPRGVDDRTGTVQFNICGATVIHK